jgi:hypothetical protein
LATCVDDIAFVRSMYTTDNDHAAEFQIHHGRHKLDERQPVIGSWIHYGLGTLNENLPQFVFIGKYKDPRVRENFNADYLGPQHSGVELSIDPENPLPFGTRSKGVLAEEQTNEFDFIHKLNELSAVEYPEDDALRARILDAARAERPNVVPLRSRWNGATRAVAAVAAVAAIGFGIWAVSLSRSLDRERSARERIEQVLADPNATRLRVSGKATGAVVVARNGEAALIVSQLDRAPSGSVYEAWVIHNGKPLRAATFAGGGKNGLVLLDRPVPQNSLVAVTLERKPGADTPHGKILLHSQSL